MAKIANYLSHVSQIVVVEPEESAVLGGGKPGPHEIQGIGAGMVPDNLHVSVFDEGESA